MLKGLLVHLNERSEQGVGIGEVLVELLARVISVSVHLDLEVFAQMRLEGLRLQSMLGHHALCIVANQNLHHGPSFHGRVK